MNKIKKLIKKYLVLFCTFFIINVFFIWIVTNISGMEEQLKMNNSLLSSNAKNILFNGVNNVDKNDLLNLLKDKKVILENLITPADTKDDVEVKGVYYNYNIDKKYPLIEGRMFTKEELIGKEKVALVGYNLKDKIRNNTITIQNEDYEVVGIVGNKRTGSLKNSIFINLNSIELNLIYKAVNLDVVNENVGEVINHMAKTFKDSKNIELYISEPYGMEDPLKDSINTNSLPLILGVLVSICLISTVINLGSYWIDREKSIIGIKSLVGGTKLSLLIRFWMEYFTTIFLSLMSSSLLWIIISYFTNINNMINFKLFALLLFVNIIVSTLAFIIPMINLMRLDINSIIKENI